jgi:hypothetical protein
VVGRTSSAPWQIRAGGLGAGCYSLGLFSTRDRIRTIAATITGKPYRAGVELDPSSTQTGVEGVTFTYGPSGDRLVYLSGRFSCDGCMVRIDVGDEDGNTATESWSFMILGRR